MFQSATWRLILAGVLLVTVTVVVYSRSFDGPFIYDDLSAIVRNPHTRAIWPLSSALSAPPRTAVSGRPIVALSLAVNYQISGLAVWSYHALNLLLHGTCAVLLLAIIHRTLGRAGSGLAQARQGLALLIALLWAVVYQQVLEEDSQNVAAIAGLALICQDQGRLDEAEALAQHRLTVQPDAADAHNNLGVIYAEQNRVAEAVKHFLRAVELDPGHENAKANLLRAQQVGKRQ